MNQCTALLLHCNDYRFVIDDMAFMNHLGFKGDFDDVAIAGAAKNIVDPYETSDVDFIIRQIEISRKVHAITKVIVINHQDCVTYGAGTFADVQEERSRHVRDLSNAKSVIEKRLDGIAVTKVFARISEEGKIDYEIIT